MNRTPDPIRIEYTADPERLGITPADMLAHRANGVRVFNAPRPLDSPIKDGAWEHVGAPFGYFVALATGAEAHPMYGTWERNMQAQNAVEVRYVANVMEALALIVARAKAEGDEEYIAEYVTGGMIFHMAYNYGLPWKREWDADVAQAMAGIGK